MKEYREYLNPTQKTLIQKLLRTFISYIEEDEELDIECFLDFLESMNTSLDTHNYIRLIEEDENDKR